MPTLSGKRGACRSLGAPPLLGDTADAAGRAAIVRAGLGAVSVEGAPRPVVCSPHLTAFLQSPTPGCSGQRCGGVQREALAGRAFAGSGRPAEWWRWHPRRRWGRRVDWVAARGTRWSCLWCAAGGSRAVRATLCRGPCRRRTASLCRFTSRFGGGSPLYAHRGHARCRCFPSRWAQFGAASNRSSWCCGFSHLCCCGSC